MSGFAFAISANGTACAIPIDDAPSATDALVWTHLVLGESEVRAWLTDRAGLAPFIVDALTATETRPRCDAVDGGAVINLRGLASASEQTGDSLASIRLFATAGRIWSVARHRLDAIDRVRGAVEAGHVLDPGDLVTEVASAITEQLDPMVADLGDELDDCEEHLDAHRAFALRRSVNRVRVAAIGYRRFVLPQRQALEKLANLPAPWLSPDDRLHLSGAADRAARMAEELEAIRERAALVHETLTDLRAEQLDQRSLIIAVAAMVFLPLTFLTGLLGMNVEGIPYAREPWAFWGVVGVCFVMAVVIAAYFIRRHWFR